MGSMPKGCPPDLYASIIKNCANESTKVLLDTVVGLSECLKMTASLGCPVLLKVNGNELLGLAKQSVLGSGQVSANEVRDAGIGFIHTWVSSLSESEVSHIRSSGSSYLYIAVTDGPHPSHFLKLPLFTTSSSIRGVSGSDTDTDTDTKGRQWLLTRSQPLPGPVVSPIGAGDATSSGTLMHWSSCLSNTVPTSAQCMKVSDDDLVVESFRWGVACGAASCMSAGNSRFQIAEVIQIFETIQVMELNI